MREGIGWWAEGKGGGTVSVTGAKAATSVKSFKAQSADVPSFLPLLLFKLKSKARKKAFFSSKQAAETQTMGEVTLLISHLQPDIKQQTPTPQLTQQITILKLSKELNTYTIIHETASVATG